MTMRKSLEAQTPPTHTRGGVKKEQQRDFSCNHCGEEFIVVVKLRSGKMTRFVRFVVSKWRLRLCESVSPDNASIKNAFFCRWNVKKSIFDFSHHSDQHPSARNNKNPKISLSSFLLVIGKNRSILGRRQKNAIRFDHSDHMTAPFGSGLSFCPILAIVITIRIVWIDDSCDERLPSFDCFDCWNVHKTLSQSQHGYLLDLFPYQWLFDGNHHGHQNRP